ncbi:hypothetical protein [Chromobacterium violaceum]|uniref:Uncharacterized protein n=1 Tax=Chromobacterium violaceum TaxID=536 RepID=A0A202BDD2_CHRVL|nr:hypothetical protein [Chromobacterium violaceum]OVE49412.1 hypothetical protein CBW21_05890 [Chromobacterium violaceum]
MQPNTQPRQVWSRNGETFQADSLHELINDYELGPGSVAHVGDVQEHGTDWIDANDVIEQIANRGADEGGEFADDFPDVSAEAKAELDEFLKRWQAEHCVANFFLVVNVRHHTITEADIEEAACKP